MDRTRIRELRRKLQLGTGLSENVIIRLSMEDTMSPVLRLVVAEAKEHITRNEADEAVAEGMAFAKTLGDRVTGAMQRSDDAVVARMREALGKPKGVRHSPERAILHDIKAMIALNIAQGYVESGRKVVGRHRRREMVLNVWYTVEEVDRNGWITHVDESMNYDGQREMIRARDPYLIEQCAHFVYTEPRTEFQPATRCQRDATAPGKRFCELHGYI